MLPRETPGIRESDGHIGRHIHVHGHQHDDGVTLELEALHARLGVGGRTPHERATLEALGSMAAVLAHELQNCLTPVCGYSSLALLSLDGDAPARRSVERAHAAAERCRQVAASIVAIAKGDVIRERTWCEVGAIVNEAIAMMGREPGRLGISIAADVEQGLAVAARPTAMVQVLTNVLLNACRAVSGGGAITIAACSTGNTPTDVALIEVHNTGPSLTPEQLQELRSGRAAGGLGIPISRWLCETSGGRFEIESPGPGGTTIRIAMPIASVLGNDDHILGA